LHPPPRKKIEVHKTGPIFDDFAMQWQLSVNISVMELDRQLGNSIENKGPLHHPKTEMERKQHSHGQLDLQ